MPRTGCLYSQREAATVYKRDRKEALRLLIKSAELGKTEAQCQYAQLLAEGAGGVKRDEREACEWLRIADCAEARYRLGLFTFEGRGTRKDPEKAHSLIADAASEGHMAAADWLHRKDGPSPRRPPPPSPPPVPRVSKKDGPPSPERVSNDGDALRGALSEARAVAAAARVARTAAEDDAKRLRKERDDYRSKLEQAQRLLEVAKKHQGATLYRGDSRRATPNNSRNSARPTRRRTRLFLKTRVDAARGQKACRELSEIGGREGRRDCGLRSTGESCGSAGEGGRAAGVAGLRARARDRVGGAAHEARRGLDEIAISLGRRCG